MSDEKKNVADNSTSGQQPARDGHAQPLPQKKVAPPQIVVDPAIQGWLRESDDGKR